MINIILIFLMIIIVAKLMKNYAPKIEPVKPTCPPHSWGWEKMYNQDGTIEREHIVCAKCGPINGEKDE